MSTDFLAASIKSAQTTEVNLPQVVPTGYELVMLDVNSIEFDPQQPRKEWPEQQLNELADSIEATNGCVMPIKVRIKDNEPNKYLLVFGEGRLRSHRLKNISHICALVPNHDSQLDLAQVRKEQVIENVVRTPMTRLEEAISYLSLMEEYNLTRKQLMKVVGASDAKISRLFKLAASTQKVKKLCAFTSSYNLLATMADLQNLMPSEDFDKLVQQVEKKDLNEKAAQKIKSDLKKQSEKYGHYNRHDPIEKALFDLLNRFDLAFEISQEQKEEAAEKLTTVIGESEEITELSQTELLTLFVLKIQEPDVVKTILNIRKLREFFREAIASKKLEDSYSKHYKAVALVANNELDDTELQEAEETLSRVCSEYGIEDPEKFVSEDWTVDNLQQESLMRALAEEFTQEESSQLHDSDFQASRQIVMVSSYEFDKDGSCVLCSSNGKTLVNVPAKLMKEIVAQAKKVKGKS